MLPVKKPPFKNIADIEKSLKSFLAETNLPEKLTVEDIKDIVWNEDDPKIHSRLIGMFMDHTVDQGSHQAILDILSDAWNYFPHQSLNGFSPRDLLNETVKGL